MKIVWTNQFAQLPEVGGGTRHIELAIELKELFGVETTIIAGNKNYLSGEKVFEKEGCYRINGIDFCVIDIAYKPGYVRRAYSWIEFAFKIKKVSERFREADVVIGSTPTLFGAYSTMNMAKKYKTPFVLEVRDLWPEILRDSGKLSEKSPFYILMDKISKKLYREAHYIITLSEGQKRYIAKFTQKPIEVVYNGMSDRLIKEFTNVKKLEGFNIVYAGALGYANDVDTIIKTAELLNGIQDIKIHILGDGTYKKKIQDAIKKGLSNINFYGMLPKKEAFRIMSQCQIGLLTLKNIELFRYGVSPNKLFDYLSLGLFVISTVKGEIEEILDKSGYGITVEAEKPEILLLTIKRLYNEFIKNPDVFTEDTGKKFVKNNYSRKKMAERLFRVLNSISLEKK